MAADDEQPYATASLAAFTGRPLMTLRAGLALKTVGSLVNGLMSLVVLNAIFPSPNRVPRFPTGSVMAA